jgi:hypothetical protein
MPQACDGTDRAPWSVGVSGSAFDTEIVFDGEPVRTRQHAVSLSAGRSSSPRLSWGVTGSWVTGGDVEDRDVKGGFAVSGSVTALTLYETPSRPFIALTGSAGVSRVRAVADDGRVRDWAAGDVRAGVAAGKTIGPVVPYLAARAFGGPVNWRRQGGSVVGTDRHHVTAGGGLTVRLPAALDLTVEAMPLGERSVAAGLTRHF